MLCAYVNTYLSLHTIFETYVFIWLLGAKPMSPTWHPSLLASP